MRVTVHIADMGARSWVRALRGVRADGAGAVPGLRSADVALAAPLRVRSLPSLQPGRVALIAFWDGDEAVDAWEATEAGAVFGGGFSMRLEPLRRWGSWPGLDESVPVDKSVPHEGPAAVVTLARTRMTQLVRFLRTSHAAEVSAVRSPGLLWGTAMAKPPFFATVSLWESTRALSTYAYGRRDPGHADAIEVDRAKPFHHVSAFIRFRPYAVTGSLSGRNPLPAGLLEDIAAP